MKPFYIIIGIVVILGLGLIATGVMKGKKAANEAPASLAPLANSADLVAKAKGVVRGNTNAPVKVMVFSDFQCPWCALYATTIENQLKQTYVDAGKVVEIYHDYPIGGEYHKYGFMVARAARCADDQNKFWEFHDVAFQKQNEWSASSDLPTKLMSKYAADLGMDKKKFDACLQSDDHADVVEYNHQLGEQAGVNSTPTIFINGKKAEHPNEWDKFKVEIDAALGPNAAATTSAAPVTTAAPKAGK
jgi:protein-disulfide isomerase